jgi:hypothetical protein
MDFTTLRNYSQLSQASYRGLTQLISAPDARDLESALTSNAPNALSPDNRFAEVQAKLLTGSTTASDPSDGFTFIDQRPNTATGFSGTVFHANGMGWGIASVLGQKQPVASNLNPLYRSPGASITQRTAGPSCGIVQRRASARPNRQTSR